MIILKVVMVGSLCVSIAALALACWHAPRGN